MDKFLEQIKTGDMIVYFGHRQNKVKLVSESPLKIECISSDGIMEVEFDAARSSAEIWKEGSRIGRITEFDVDKKSGVYDINVRADVNFHYCPK